MSNYFHLTNEGHVATLCFDTPKKSANILSQEALEELDNVLEQLKKDQSIHALQIISAKKNIFIAGADINEILAIDSEETSIELVSKGQKILQKISSLPFVTIAVINGACLGGGFELAMWCDYRICTENKATKIGLPEVNLGVLPGFGGTQKLKELVGLSKALELILGAKQINGAKALKLGMVDACVPEGYLEFKLKSFTDDILSGKIQKRICKPTLLEQYLSTIIFFMAKKTVMEKTNGKYPAPLEVISLMEKTNGMNLQNALELEVKSFAKLVLTQESRNLISLFFSMEAVKNEKPLVAASKIKDITFASVVGGGIMGSGIVWLFSKIDLLVRLNVRGYEQAAKTLQGVFNYFEPLRKRKRLTKQEIDMKMARISYGTDISYLSKSDLVIEAIVENVEAKQKTFEELEKSLKDDAIIATNTSSLSVNLLSSKMQHPERFIGMHFFNPVPLMPLVEVIPADVTDKTVTASVVALAKKAGKTPVVVKDCAGFLVNRILLPYINESAKILSEGSSVKQIDKTIKDFGMPMGPFTLADEVGLDVGLKVANVLYEGYGERMEVSGLLKSVVNDMKLLGKKDKKGFYIHNKKDKKPNPEIDILQTSSKSFDNKEIIDRCMLIMVNEAAYCLEEKVVKNAQQLDVAMVMGTGFPPFRGGLLKYADNYGLSNVVSALENLEKKYGMRFKPAPMLDKLAKNGELFYKG